MRVKLVCVALGLAAALSSTSPGDAGQKFLLQGCDDLLQQCNLIATQQPGRISLAQCKGLYDAAEKAGGQWGLPEAQAATHTRGNTLPCFP
jgi:hypothetical protein